MRFGIRANLAQVLHQLLQVLLVGMTIGMMRNVVPALAETEFGVPRGSFLLLSAFVVAFGFVKGTMNFVAGRLSDRLGRHRLNVGGMWLCGAGVALLPLGEGSAWWSASAAVAGLGMAMLYPNLSAAVADIAHPAWRASAIGIYRFWRDLGYGIGALGLGAAAALGGQIEHAFWFVAASMLLSGALLLAWSEETHPRLNPAH